MLQQYEPTQIARWLEEKLLENFGTDPQTATPKQIYKAVCYVLRDIMSELWLVNHNIADSHRNKQVYYLSMEFLPGPSLKNNAFNLHLEDAFRQALASIGQDFARITAMEPDAGLGNGGLGRLASCYLDAIAAKGMAGHGMSICYEYGIFRQKIEDGEQTELPDEWLNMGDVWLITKEDQTEEVHFGGKLEEIWDANGRLRLIHKDYTTVLAVPRDMLITGYDSDVVNTLRLWQAKSPITIDMKLFAEGKYLQSMEEKHMAEVISKILYPEDAHTEGKLLRMKQQYFFIAASMKSLVKRHMMKYGTLDNFSDKVAVHINDTHPTMAIPELMRIFMDEYGYEWDQAWDIVRQTVSYTNHTVMPEALEKWPESLFKETLPRLHSIVSEINRRQSVDLMKTYPDNEALRRDMAVINNGELRMANLCVEASHTVNGVSSLHSGIIRDQLFAGFSAIHPEKFTNVTNGIAYRRWLCQANPELSELIVSLIGPGFKKDAMELERLMAFTEDRGVFTRLEQIKRRNKERLADYIKEHNNIMVDPDSIFDVQVKRLHEYKRQLLNLLHIIHLYAEIKRDPGADIQPRTFIFAAKAAAGYYMAKQIIKLAYHLAQVINNDSQVNGRIKIVFLENYSVSLSELIMPAAEISEQISLAGKEASGTGNMKLMINGAVTLGTEDGANVEIHRAVGDENIFIFGLRVEDVERIRREGSYSPFRLCQTDGDVNEVVQFLSQGVNGQYFSNILNALTTGYNGCADPYFVLGDFGAYRDAQARAAAAYRDRDRWNRMSLINIAKAGIFSADRAVQEYADRIWHIEPLK
ncbi:glycogen/starch/alpha-glucan phosphorylase [Bacilliculturomica massiliensis]|uniref:glycogen/starch/alpha-glucan phosphorylase n=1 Tax=Bacilliculturomica massiliensis TaxID=1917867 RepID=UPI00102FC0BF|nr:glycogen/starch/alpha-glucan phosphorylase [Bacilliculturomica massiliensis]